MERKEADIYGIVASMLGIEVTDAADQDLILSSNFPMLKIDAVKPFTLTSTYGNEYTIHTHNYGYPPFFILYQVVGGALIQDYFFDEISVTNTAITLFDFTSPFVGSDFVPQTRDFVLVVCRNPLTKPYTTPVFRTQSVEAAALNRDYGLITSKPGKDASSTDMRDFTFHSNARNLLIHAVDYREMTTTTMTWTNNLPYRPLFFGFISLDSGASFQALYGGGQAPPIDQQDDDGNVIIQSFTPAPGTKHYGSIWVFKDPFDIGGGVTITI